MLLLKYIEMINMRIDREQIKRNRTSDVSQRSPAIEKLEMGIPGDVGNGLYAFHHMRFHVSVKAYKHGCHADWNGLSDGLNKIRDEYCMHVEPLKSRTNRIKKFAVSGYGLTCEIIRSRFKHLGRIKKIKSRKIELKCFPGAGFFNSNYFKEREKVEKLSRREVDQKKTDKGFLFKVKEDGFTVACYVVGGENICSWGANLEITYPEMLDEGLIGHKVVEMVNYFKMHDIEQYLKPIATVGSGNVINSKPSGRMIRSIMPRNRMGMRGCREEIMVVLESEGIICYENAITILMRVANDREQAQKYWSKIKSDFNLIDDIKMGKRTRCWRLSRNIEGDPALSVDKHAETLKPSLIMVEEHVASKTA